MMTRRTLSLAALAFTTGAAGREFNLFFRGQSNALILVARGGMSVLKADLVQRLGIAVHLIGDYAERDNTIFAGTAFMDWGTAGQQASLIRYLAAQPESIRRNPTITVWMHNEGDQKNTALTTAEWVRAVRADAVLVRKALGQSPRTTPYLFVPIRYPYGDLTAISNGMDELVADPTFHAARSDAALAPNILMNGGPEPGHGSSHMSDEDAVTLGHALTDSVAALYRSIR
jgi:hypothetical protein